MSISVGRTIILLVSVERDASNGEEEVTTSFQSKTKNKAEWNRIGFWKGGNNASKKSEFCKVIRTKAINGSSDGFYDIIAEWHDFFS